MKNIHNLLLAVLVVASPLAPASMLIDDAPPGFVHLRDQYGDGTANDYYVNAAHIISVRVSDSASTQDSRPAIIITTTAIKPRTVGNERAGSVSVSYVLHFQSRKEAEKAARKVMAIVRNAEQGVGLDAE